MLSTSFSLTYRTAPRIIAAAFPVSSASSSFSFHNRLSYLASEATSARSQNIGDRRFSTAPLLRLKEIVETVSDGGETVVEGVKLDVPRGRVLRIQDADGTDRSIFDDEEFWSLLSHTDVLILRQFLNSDYTVLPIEVTGLKYHQQLRLAQLVKKAQRANLIPLKVRELKDTVPFKSELNYGDYDHTKYNTYYDDWDKLY